MYSLNIKATPQAGFEPATPALASHILLPEPVSCCGLDYIFTISGERRIVSKVPLVRKLPRGRPYIL